MSTDKLQEALNIIKEHKTELSESTERSILVYFDLDEMQSYSEEFKTEQDFFDRFKDTEIDCEGFSWTLWEDGYIFEFNRMYHLVKIL